jgi:hypothetical protein
MRLIIFLPFVLISEGLARFSEAVSIFLTPHCSHHREPFANTDNLL